MNKRSELFYLDWLDAKPRMSYDDWLYIASLCVVANLSVGLGFIIGSLI